MKERPRGPSQGTRSCTNEPFGAEAVNGNDRRQSNGLGSHQGTQAISYCTVNWLHCAHRLGGEQRHHVFCDHLANQGFTVTAKFDEAFRRQHRVDNASPKELEVFFSFHA